MAGDNGQPDEIRCPGCDRLVAKKIGPGRYETKMRHNQNRTFCARITVAEVQCPRCKTWIYFPPTSPKQGPKQEGAENGRRTGNTAS